MTITRYSHAFLVGVLNVELKPSQLSKEWERQVMPNNGEHGYDNLCKLYYKGYVDSMLQAQHQKRPKFVDGVCHYIHMVESSKQRVSLSRIIERKKKYADEIESCTIQHIDGYNLKVCAIHLYFFPLRTALFAIEIDDSGSELNALTMGHFCLMNWIWEGECRFHDNSKIALCETLAPLQALLIKKKKTLASLMAGGSKMKIFRTIQLEGLKSITAPNTFETMLYEIGTNAPIGCVNGNAWLSPSKVYYESIMKDNIVSVFKSWKALALMDSFTLLGTEDGFREKDWNMLYFPLIYLRCFYEKSFCFSRNNNYREGRVKGNLSRDIAQMEKFYFYQNISYNFLPNLLYKAMAKGLELEDERLELSKQIKEKSERNKDIILGFVSAFAIFSIVYDLYSIIISAMGVPTESVPSIAIILFALGVVSIISINIYLLSRRIE